MWHNKRNRTKLHPTLKFLSTRNWLDCENMHFFPNQWLAAGGKRLKSKMYSWHQLKSKVISEAEKKWLHLNAQPRSIRPGMLCALKKSYQFWYWLRWLKNKEKSKNMFSCLVGSHPPSLASDRKGHRECLRETFGLKSLYISIQMQSGILEGMHLRYYQRPPLNLKIHQF